MDLRDALPKPPKMLTSAPASSYPTYFTAAMLGLVDGMEMEGDSWKDSNRWPETEGWANQLCGWSRKGRRARHSWGITPLPSPPSLAGGPGIG